MTEHAWVEVRVAAHPVPGEQDSGDRHVLCPFPGGVLVGVLDGLGHGPEASEAAHLAATTLEEHAPDSIASLMALCHERLRLSRGVAMNLASFHYENSSMTWAGLGNVKGLLVRRSSSSLPLRRSLLVKAGVVGIKLARLQPETLAVARGDTVVFSTDGIRGDFESLVAPAATCQGIADRILRLHSRTDDDALVLVARYLRSEQ